MIRHSQSYLFGAISGTAVIAAAVVVFVLLVSAQALRDWPIGDLHRRRRRRLGRGLAGGVARRAGGATNAAAANLSGPVTAAAGEGRARGQGRRRRQRPGSRTATGRQGLAETRIDRRPRGRLGAGPAALAPASNPRADERAAPARRLGNSFAGAQWRQRRRRAGPARTRARRRARGTSAPPTARRVTDTVNETVQRGDATGGVAGEHRRHRSHRRSNRHRRVGPESIGRRSGRRSRRSRSGRPHAAQCPSMSLRSPSTVTMPPMAEREQAGAVRATRSRVRRSTRRAAASTSAATSRSPAATSSSSPPSSAPPPTSTPRTTCAPAPAPTARPSSARTDDFEVLFASKSLPCTAAYRLFAEEGLSVDVASGGELHMALRAGFDPGAHPHARQQQDRRGDPLRGPRRHRPPDPRLLRRDRALRAAARRRRSGC